MYIKCGGIYPAALEEDTEDALQEYLLKIFKKHVSNEVTTYDFEIEKLEFIHTSSIGVGVDLQLNVCGLASFFINEKDTPEIYRLYKDGWCTVNMYSDITFTSFRRIQAWGGVNIDVFDYDDDCLEADYEKIYDECNIIDRKIADILRENNDNICDFLLQYEIPDDYDDDYYYE